MMYQTLIKFFLQFITTLFKYNIHRRDYSPRYPNYNQKVNNLTYPLVI